MQIIEKIKQINRYELSGATAAVWIYSRQNIAPSPRSQGLIALCQ
jgi:hypothetical protein